MSWQEYVLFEEISVKAEAYKRFQPLELPGNDIDVDLTRWRTAPGRVDVLPVRWRPAYAGSSHGSIGAILSMIGEASSQGPPQSEGQELSVSEPVQMPSPQYPQSS